jgi:hypothetical protein
VEPMYAVTPERRPPEARGKELTTVERLCLAAEYSKAIVPGAKAQLCRAWQVTKQTAAAIVRKWLAQLASPGAVDMARGKRKGRPSGLDEEGAWEGVLERLEVHKRSNFRKWAKRAGMPKSTLHRWAQVKNVQRRGRYIKPKLTDSHKHARMAFVLSRVDPATLTARHPAFSDHFDIVHGDEKWFYKLQDGKTVLVAPGEAFPDPPKLQHKSHIPKAMFIALAARPQPARHFDGKVGIWSCTKIVEAQRNSKNHKAGDLLEVDVPVTAEYYREVIEQKIMPAIIEAMPWAGKNGRTLIYQHDGATPHSGGGNRDYWQEMLARLYPDRSIKVLTQPAQSPDLNTLDLGFFHSLANLAYDTDPDTLSDLLDAVEECYWDYDSDTLERVWQAQFNVYNCILEARGDNNFQLPHTGVSKRQRAGTLLVCAPVNRRGLKACTPLIAAQAV